MTILDQFARRNRWAAGIRSLLSSQVLNAVLIVIVLVQGYIQMMWLSDLKPATDVLGKAWRPDKPICEFGRGWIRDNMPEPSKHCDPRRNPLVIVAGEAKSGIGSVAWALGEAPGNWSCERGTTEVKKHKSLSTEYEDIRNQIASLDKAEFSTHDWCKPFLNFDAIADLPISQLFPYIYAAHQGVGVKVILPIRNATNWADRQWQWAGDEQGWSDIAPFGWIFSRTIWDGYDKNSPFSVRAVQTIANSKDVPPPQLQIPAEIIARSGQDAVTWAYLAQIALLACVVPPGDILYLDVFSDKPEDLWRRTAAFLNRPLNGIKLTDSFGSPPVPFD